MSFEVPAESVGTVTGASSWRQRIPNLGDVTEKLQAPYAVRANGTLSRLMWEDLRERAGV